MTLKSLRRRLSECDRDARLLVSVGIADARRSVQELVLEKS